MAADEKRYAAIGYSVPASPSKVRVYVWRKLRQFGAENIKPGLAVLPDIPENRKLFTDLSKTIREMSGEASCYTLIFSDPAEEAELMRRFAKRTQEALEKLQEQLRIAVASPDTASNRRLIKAVEQTIDRYDKMGPPPDPTVRQEIEGTMRTAMDTLKSLPGAFGDELKDLFK